MPMAKKRDGSSNSMDSMGLGRITVVKIHGAELYIDSNVDFRFSQTEEQTTKDAFVSCC